jgi:hypothetical protein
MTLVIVRHQDLVIMLMADRRPGRHAVERGSKKMATTPSDAKPPLTSAESAGEPTARISATDAALVRQPRIAFEVRSAPLLLTRYPRMPSLSNDVI